MRVSLLARTWVTVVIAVFVAASCAPQEDAAEPREGPEITVASFDFVESATLAEIYAQALESEGFPVARRINLGTRELVQPALERGEVDLLPEYTGTALTFLTDPEQATSDEDETHGRLEEAFADRGVTVLDAAPAQNRNAIVVTAETAEEHDLETISDLQPIAGNLVFGGPPECPQRPACLIGLGDVYGLEFADFRPLDAGGPITVAALQGGEIDVALLFSTQGIIGARGFVVLEDDEGLQPAENVVPVVRTEIVEAYGDELTDLLNSISSRLTTQELIALNERTEVENEDPDIVARDWLEENGFLD